ncbi:hypothetical protein C5470_06285 [Photorhabdus stackebrandtii]|uniref:Uncharacterized protein n=1 Tax=Photorhabdus stackebrandtii TaxID=1123042 RepID=A0A7X5QKM3_9GAMM|nr:hypothetical protein [Photorhabdus stackebrandtii]
MQQEKYSSHAFRYEKIVLAHSLMTEMYQNEFNRTKKSIITFSYNLNHYVKALSSLEKSEKIVYTSFHFQPEQNC